MTRIYLDSPLSAGQAITLPDAAARHVVGVLRLRAGNELIVFNGRGGEYSAVIRSCDRRHAAIEVLAHSPRERESPLAVTLAQALSRGDRMDFSIQKAVELGVTRIVPFNARRTNVKLSGKRAATRLGHWLGVVRHACEQCGRNTLPAVAPLQSLETLLNDESFDTVVVLDPTGTGELPAVGRQAGTILLVIGPEGGFDAEELARLNAAQAVRVRFGPRILRTETATVAGLVMLQSRYGDLGSTA